MLRFLESLAGGLAIFLTSMVFACAALAQEDPHQLYESKCRNCHSEHGADFARQKLKLERETLVVAQTGTQVEVLLRKHHGVAISDPQRVVLLGLFRSGIKWAGVFQHRCAQCHGKAVDFARSRLVVQDGQITSREGATNVAVLLKLHGGASNDEIAILVEMFRYQIATEVKK